MNQYLLLPLLLAIGFVLGLVYFAGLMKTLDNLTVLKKWQLLMVISFILRVTLLVGAFYLLARNDWQRLVALVLGFMAARIYMVRHVNRKLQTGKGQE